ncbi:MAG TPA: hypothetical protein PKW15_00355 [Alphaproteobacteria bacterium]|mgnify:CR=1 FL=1|nr:hypothetical protein [Alphaproteobacteria bacterium]
MSLRRSLLLTVFISAFALTACETLGLEESSDMAEQNAPPATTMVSGSMAPVVQPMAPMTINNPMTTSQTLVGRQISQLRNDLNTLLSDVNGYAATQNDLRNRNQSMATSYYNIIGEINAKLQTGTTPGNPRLVQRWQDASNALDQFAATSSEMNGLSSRIGSSASMANYLLDATRATYSLSGAVEEDHQSLRTLEDDVQRSVISIQRAYNDLTQDVGRQNAYVASERRNLQTLSLAIARGEVYGQNLGNLAAANMMGGMGVSAPTTSVTSENLPTGVLGRLPAGATPAAAPAAKTPFVIVRFDRADVDYGQPLYQAMSQALEKNPMGSFEVVAVSPRGSGTKQTLAGTTARSKAEDVMRTMSEMGVPADRMQLTTATNPNSGSPEVHIFLR